MLRQLENIVIEQGENGVPEGRNANSSNSVLSVFIMRLIRARLALSWVSVASESSIPFWRAYKELAGNTIFVMVWI